MTELATTWLNGRITLHPDVCNGQPTIRGKRITVHTILEFLSAGETPEMILHHYPSLELQDIYACLAFASTLMTNKYSSLWFSPELKFGLNTESPCGTRRC